jgi:hypothetical protein
MTKKRKEKNPAAGIIDSAVGKAINAKLGPPSAMSVTQRRSCAAIKQTEGREKTVASAQSCVVVKEERER